MTTSHSGLIPTRLVLKLSAPFDRPELPATKGIPRLLRSAAAGWLTSTLCWLFWSSAPACTSVARMQKMKESHRIIGDARGKGLLLAVDLVKDRTTREAFPEAGKMVYEKAFSKGLAWIPAGNILRLAPPLGITEELAGKAMDIVDEAIGETEKALGYVR